MKTVGRSARGAAILSLALLAGGCGALTPGGLVYETDEDKEMAENVVAPALRDAYRASLNEQGAVRARKPVVIEGAPGGSPDGRHAKLPSGDDLAGDDDDAHPGSVAQPTPQPMSPGSDAMKKHHAAGPLTDPPAQ